MARRDKSLGSGHDDLERLQEILRVRFKNPRLLAEAITHSSFEGGGLPGGNERLEFLGDAVLKLVTAWHLYVTYPDYPEGDLSSMLGRAVSEKALADAAACLGLGDFLRLGHGLELAGGRTLPSILADAFEAVLGAVFLDRGLEAALRMATRELEPAMSIGPGADNSRNYKAILQEIFQKKEKYIPGYQVVSETGPDHDKTFVVEVSSASGTIGRGTGKTKKEAEQAAAKDALSRMGVWAPHEATAIQGGEARDR